MNEIALHIMDIMQNSITAQSREIKVSLRVTDDDELLRITVEDNGCGMDEETLKRAEDPFHTSRSTRMVGLGIPMFKEAALLTGGEFTLESQQGVGTKLTATFVNHSIDRQPLGDVGNIFFLTLLSYQDIAVVVELQSVRGTFVFESARYGGRLLSEDKAPMDVAFDAQTIINRQVEMIFKGILPEIGDVT